MSNHYRQTWATINLDYLWENYQYLSSIANKPLIPVIKADGYGHGSKQIFNFLYEKGIRFFAVSLIEEALELRKIHKDADLLIMGAILKEHFDVISENNLIFTLYDEEIYEALLLYEKPIRFHLKLDTGMHRYGISDLHMAKKMVDSFKTKPNVSYEGIYTHFATANDDPIFYQKQLSTFKHFIDSCSYIPKIVHVSNSSSIFQYERNIDYTTHGRLGISLYGLSLDDPYPKIKPVMSLYTKVIQIKHLKPNDGLGYGQTYKAKTDEIIALLPIGYADGLIRKNKGFNCFVNGKYYPLVGNICMDTCFIKVDASVSKHDVVTIFGEGLHVDQIASRLGTINYEITTNVSKRVPRKYIKDGKMYD
jgi:alanine racemase